MPKRARIMLKFLNRPATMKHVLVASILAATGSLSTAAFLDAHRESDEARAQRVDEVLDRLELQLERWEEFTPSAQTTVGGDVSVTVGPAKPSLRDEARMDTALEHILSERDKRNDQTSRGDSGGDRGLRLGTDRAVGDEGVADSGP